MLCSVYSGTGLLPQLSHHSGLYISGESPESESALAWDGLSERTNVRETPVRLERHRPLATVAAGPALPAAHIHDLSDSEHRAMDDVRAIAVRRSGPAETTPLIANKVARLPGEVPSASAARVQRNRPTMRRPP